MARNEHPRCSFRASCVLMATLREELAHGQKVHSDRRVPACTGWLREVKVEVVKVVEVVEAVVVGVASETAQQWLKHYSL
jgi:hypothetical protein